jgi:hypothetical protein
MTMKALFAAAILVASGTAIAQPPQRDARGIPVQSAEATAPEGTNQTVNVPAGAQVTLVNPQQFFATRPATGTYPPCARGQTDGCVQTYERGARAPR